MAAAKRAGTVVSYDLNYRPSLWKSMGGKSKAQEVNRRLAPLVDVMLGNEEDFTAALGFPVSGLDDQHSVLLTDLNWQVQNGLSAVTAWQHPEIAVARIHRPV